MGAAGDDGAADVSALGEGADVGVALVAVVDDAGLDDGLADGWLAIDPGAPQPLNAMAHTLPRAINTRVPGACINLMESP